MTLAGYAVIALAILTWHVVCARRAPAETLGAVVRWLASRRAAHLTLMAAWLWLGWHLFARAG